MVAAVELPTAQLLAGLGLDKLGLPAARVKQMDVSLTLPAETKIFDASYTALGSSGAGIAESDSLEEQMLTNAAQHKAMDVQERKAHKLTVEAGKEKDFAAAAKKRRDAT